MTRTVRILATLTLALPLQAVAQEGAPLSAIDWLSRSVETSAPGPAPSSSTRIAPDLAEPGTSSGVRTPQVTTTVLGASGLGAAGAMTPEVSGLPAEMWRGSDPDRLLDLLARIEDPTLPATQDLLVRLLLTQAEPSAGAASDLLVARIDTLLNQGRLDPAQALLDAVDGTHTPEIFRRWFDVALLTGAEDRACSAMQATPTLAPAVPARIFCQARAGDWPGAALTLNTHRALGDLSQADEELLLRFLDPELFEGEGPPRPPERVTPLTFRMMQAIGEGIPTFRLPLAFAHADLADTVGLKTRAEAAERLAARGALAAPQLAEIFLTRRPSASGGVWDRMSALQDLNAAVRITDADAISATLPAAWDAARATRSEPLLAELFAEDLPDLSGPAQDIARRMHNLAGRATEGTPPLIAALLTGDPAAVAPETSTEEAIVAAFTTAPPEVSSDLAGETLIETIDQLNAGAAGDVTAITEGLLTLRAVGLDELARQAAVELLLLDRPT
ncbi:hypothetical protein EU805_06875 [Salipiger sp. IMCC34102]|uniref:hypothetical protein n=1 Tax=Salipiger sp. IMCC34102 TaxID=2510647 RepID=UPI00101CF329|nr:hypothetical protein [Salipiger sp. IMCC34102]RYH03438.1 hypothetical protein EU805_06875 [Salipiger sp. IMCC34102]